ncbi:50S ribosomal protein L24 [Candidatus Microgenomates bacterium]|nr:50S ribosomal protein L24 [Candidatus Microgenomates bacterium]
MKLKKGDEVIVLSGRDKGRTGTVTKILPKLNKVVVNDINEVKRSYKPSTKHPKGGIKTEPRPLAASKVAIVHPDEKKRGSRIGYQFAKDGRKIRIYRQAQGKEIKDAGSSKK